MMMKMKRQHLYFLSLIAVSLIASCTKEDDGTTNQSTIIPNEDNRERVTGMFTSRLTLNDATALSNPNTYFEDATVMFVRSIQDNVLIPADSVLVNELLLNKQTDNTHYLSVGDNSLLNMRDSCYWRVADTSYKEIPAFTYNFKAPYPSILGKLPDTVTRATGFRMNIQIAEADSVVLAISGDTLNNDGFIVKTVPPSINNYGFTYEEIKSIRPSGLTGSRQQLVIQAYKTTIQQFEGRYFRFTKLFIFNAGVWVKKG